MHGPPLLPREASPSSLFGLGPPRPVLSPLAPWLRGHCSRRLEPFLSPYCLPGGVHKKLPPTVHLLSKHVLSLCLVPKGATLHTPLSLSCPTITSMNPAPLSSLKPTLLHRASLSLPQLPSHLQQLTLSLSKIPGLTAHPPSTWGGWTDVIVYCQARAALHPGQLSMSIIAPSCPGHLLCARRRKTQALPSRARPKGCAGRGQQQGARSWRGAGKAAVPEGSCSCCPWARGAAGERGRWRHRGPQNARYTQGGGGSQKPGEPVRPSN